MDRIQALDELLELTRRVGGRVTIDAVLEAVVGSALRLLPATHASIRVLDESGTNLLAGVRAGEGVESAPVTFRKGEGVIGWVAEHGEPARIGDCASDPRFVPAPRPQGFAIQSMLAVPVRSSLDVIGVLAVTSPERDAFDERDELTAMLLANSASSSIAHTRAARLALADPLTGAFSARYLIQRLVEEFERARRTGAPVSMLWIDLDRFKQVNQSVGRAAGDQVLASFAERTRQVVRRYDVLVRRAGEEFVLLMPGTAMADAIAMASRIKEVTASLPLFGGDGVNVRSTVCIGVVEWDRVEDAEQFDRRAEQAAAEARGKGLNRLAIG